MRIAIRFALLGALAIAPATAMAFWLPFMPELSETTARDIAIANGVDVIEDVDPTVDADWSVEGKDMYGNDVKIVIDGRTGAVERAEMETN